MTSVEKVLASALVVMMLLFSVAVKTREPKKRELHHCLHTPKAHELWIYHADASRRLVGTMPLALSQPLALKETDRLITGECFDGPEKELSDRLIVLLMRAEVLVDSNDNNALKKWWKDVEEVIRP